MGFWTLFLNLFLSPPPPLPLALPHSFCGLSRLCMSESGVGQRMAAVAEGRSNLLATRHKAASQLPMPSVHLLCLDAHVGEAAVVSRP